MKVCPAIASCTVVDTVLGMNSCNERLGEGWILLAVHPYPPPQEGVEFIVGWPRRYGAEYPPGWQK